MLKSLSSRMANRSSADKKSGIDGQHADALLYALDKSQAIIQFGPDGTILDANENFLNVVDYSREEIVGQKHKMFVEPGYDQSTEYKSFWESLRAGEFQMAEYKRVGKNGKVIWLQASYNPIIDRSGKVSKVIKFASDITDRVLQNSDFQGQIDAVNKSQAVISFQLDGIIIDANQNFLNALGYELSEIQGQHHRKFVESDYGQSSEYKEFWASLARGEYQSAEYKRIGKGGKEVWIQASYNPIFDPSGKPIKVVKFATDITERVLQNADYRGQIEAVNKSQAVISFELDGTIIDANQNFLQTLDYELAEIQGQHHRNLSNLSTQKVLSIKSSGPLWRGVNIRPQNTSG